MKKLVQNEMTAVPAGFRVAYAPVIEEGGATRWVSTQLVRAWFGYVGRCQRAEEQPLDLLAWLGVDRQHAADEGHVN